MMELTILEFRLQFFYTLLLFLNQSIKHLLFLFQLINPVLEFLNISGRFFFTKISKHKSQKENISDKISKSKEIRIETLGHPKFFRHKINNIIHNSRNSKIKKYPKQNSNQTQKHLNFFKCCIHFLPHTKKVIKILPCQLHKLPRQLDILHHAAPESFFSQQPPLLSFGGGVFSGTLGNIFAVSLPLNQGQGFLRTLRR